MSKHKLLTINLVASLLLGGSQMLSAQQVGLWYDTELQASTDGKTNHVNLLYLSAEYEFSQNVKINAATISIAKTRDESIIDDLQAFSNIEADSQTLALALCNVEFTLGDRHKLCVGIRNVNEDYFTSPVTSLFINSSCGIFPTLSCNMDIANYPLASMGLHYSYTAPKYCLQASVYNGQGYDRWAGGASIWRVTPRRDGVFLITQGDWQQGSGHYYAGAAMHTGTRDGAAARSTLWAYTEQTLTDRLSLIADYSHAFGHNSECTDFAGIGLQYSWTKSTFGLFSDYARFHQDEEWTTELTYKYDLNDMIFFQNSCQLILHNSWLPVGLIRVSVRIGNN